MQGMLEEEIKSSLLKNLNPKILEIENLSYLHSGHESIRGNMSQETHFKLKIKSKEFNNLSQIKRQKLVYKNINFAFEKGLHAIEMDCESDKE